MSKQNKRPAALFVLVFLLLLLSVSALYGGISLVAQPDGESLKLGTELLVGTPFSNFLVPGLILLLVFGVLPFLLIYPLLTKPPWKWAQSMNMYSNRYWAWSYSLITGIAVIIWIDVQIFLIGYSQRIQTIIGVLGVLIVIFTLWPSVMNHFRRNRIVKPLLGSAKTISDDSRITDQN